jgi:ABC-type Na+ efflux pump permease subunit
MVARTVCIPKFNWHLCADSGRNLPANSDLGHEESRGILNFIRLSPQSPENILVGKLLGVPILLYVVAVLAVPLHLWAGLAAQISLIRILSFYGVLIAACFFFYSAALLFSLVSSWLGGFQAWLGSGGVLIFLFLAIFKPIDNTLFDWPKPIFSPRCSSSI